MQELIDSYKQTQNLHHAYFLIGDGEEIFVALKNFLKESVGIKTVGSADFWHGKFDNLNIDGARSISLSQGRKDFGGERKFFVIHADFITEEAQNSLLKVFEEPTPGTHFFIISPQDILLPTLRSRVQVIMGTPDEDSAKSILNLKLSDRLEIVKEITEGISDEEKTKQDAVRLLNQIEKELYNKGLEKNSNALKLCEVSRLSIYDRGAPIKIILENLMLNV